MLTAQTSLPKVPNPRPPPPKSYATMRSNPHASCLEAAANAEARRCKEKRICVNNQSDAVLTVRIGTFGRNDAYTAPTRIAVGGEVCKAVFLYGQDGGGIGIFTITAGNVLSEHPISIPTSGGAFTPVNYNRTPTTVDGLPYYEKSDNWPEIGAKPLGVYTVHYNWKLTVYGRKFPMFNFCGSKNKADAVAVKYCTWSVE
jgi:hypothetical protein